MTAPAEKPRRISAAARIQTLREIACLHGVTFAEAVQIHRIARLLKNTPKKD